MPRSPAPSIPPAAFVAAGRRKLAAAGLATAAAGVFAHCLLSFL
ncbi:hypothetical protein [Salipiger mangrovisoli]|nr:hypothetical protein [Salipiger mangrovisoli]